MEFKYWETDRPNRAVFMGAAGEIHYLSPEEVEKEYCRDAQTPETARVAIPHDVLKAAINVRPFNFG